MNLRQGNDSCMFVTIFCGILNTKTGEVLYANGGHNSPLIISDGHEATFLNGKRGLVVGPVEESVYETETFSLQPGETIFLYTDGVTEAMNGEGDLFSDDRLKEEITKLQRQTVAGNDLDDDQGDCLLRPGSPPVR